MKNLALIPAILSCFTQHLRWTSYIQRN
uniref:Uncharacterized protein n=1 Tax=Rhizophora mucronata TaxID=61149 RepID=A0A2P2PVH8_RHIMU